MNKLITTLKRHYHSSNLIRAALWLYIFGIVVFSLSLNSEHVAQAWLFTEQNNYTLSAAALVIGIPLWLIIYGANKSNDHDFKQRKLRLKYRMKCYQQLESCVHPEDTGISLRNLEHAIRDIQIFGEDDERKLAQNLSTRVQKTGGYKYQDVFDLLLVMRRHLREDFGVRHPDNDTFFTLRIATATQKVPAPASIAKTAPKKAPVKKKSTVTKKPAATKKTATKKKAPVKTNPAAKKPVKKAAQK